MQGGLLKKQGNSLVRMPVQYLCLAGETEIRDALKPIGDGPFAFVGHRPSSIAGAHSMLKSGSVALALIHIPDPSVAGGPLSAALPAQTVLFPPLVAVVGRTPTTDERDLFRIQGVAHILERPLNIDRDTGVFEVLARSRSWMTASLERMPLPDVLQTMAAHRQSGMLTITAHGMPGLSSTPWSGLDKQFLCGRLYVIEGRLVHAETSSLVSVKALAAMLRMDAGLIRVHEVFLSPSTPNMKGSLHSNLIEAAWHNDEGSRTDGHAAGSLPPATSWHPPVGGVTANEQHAEVEEIEELTDSDLQIDVDEATPARASSSQQGEVAMTNLDALLKFANDLRTCAKADKEGNVLEHAGVGDAESICAIAALSTQAVEHVSELLGLGTVQGYTFVGHKLAMYVQDRPEDFVVAVGEATKSTDATMKKVAEKFGSVA